MVLAIVILLLAACSAPAEQLNQEGNQAFAEQAYLEALELYQSAQIESPELAEPYFNAANTFYRQADYPTALEQMQLALQYVDEETLAESSLYNMGNTLFNSQDLGTAVEAYKQALLLNPDDQDAKYNLELNSSKINNNRVKTRTRVKRKLNQIVRAVMILRTKRDRMVNLRKMKTRNPRMAKTRMRMNRDKTAINQRTMTSRKVIRKMGKDNPRREKTPRIVNSPARLPRLDNE
jgi:tetratricopeptide (TPR) repeat protein